MSYTMKLLALILLLLPREEEIRRERMVTDYLIEIHKTENQARNKAPVPWHGFGGKYDVDRRVLNDLDKAVAVVNADTVESNSFPQDLEKLNRAYGELKIAMWRFREEKRI